MVRLGIIGCGYWGPNLVRTLSEMEDVQLTRVSDIRPGRLQFIAERYPDIIATQEAAKVLGDPEIAGVVIATPPKTHHKLALAALQAGKHVLVEKPLATSVAEGQELVDLAMRSNRVLAVGHLFLYAPPVARIRSLFEEEKIGDLYYISAVRTNVGPPEAQVDVLWDLAPHDISIILNLFKESPKEIFAQGASFTTSRLVDTAFLILRFADGRMAHVHVGWLTPNKVRLMRLVCSRGEVVYDEMQPAQKVQVYSPAVDNRAGANNTGAPLRYGSGGIWSPSLDSFEPLRAECQDFVNSIRMRTSPLSDGQSALEVLRVLETASHCLKNGGRADLPAFFCDRTGRSEAVNVNNFFAHPQSLVESNEIGSGTRVWAFAHVMKGVRIGRNCNIGEHCFLETGVMVGDDVVIKNGVSLWEGVFVENRVFLGPNCVFTNDLFPRSKVVNERIPTHVREGASIGANATLLCGIEIGRYSLVGAGSVVTASVPDFALVAGNPARLRRYVCCCGEKLTFLGEEPAACSCGLAYEKQGSQVRILVPSGHSK